MAIHFFSYGDEKYTKSKIRIKNEAQNFKLFDEIKIYSREDISDEFIKKTSPYINMNRGGGYWLWKPFFLKKTFDKMEYGDYCVYVDAGCTINPFGIERFNYYIDLLEKSDSGIFRFSFPGTKEKLFTTQKVFEFFEKDEEEFKSSDHLMATILIFKKCKISTEYVNRLYETSINNPSIFSDEYNEIKKNDGFLDHRHDQSVSSCLAKIISNDLVLITDETYAADNEGWRNLFYEKKIPFLSTRIRQ